MRRRFNLLPGSLIGHVMNVRRQRAGSLGSGDCFPRQTSLKAPARSHRRRIRLLPGTLVLLRVVAVCVVVVCAHRSLSASGLVRRRTPPDAAGPAARLDLGHVSV